MKENRLIFFLFGATGDLAIRKLYPALYRLYKKKQIADHFAVIATARSQWSNTYLREIIKESIAKEIEDENDADKFLTHFYYCSHDINNASQYSNLKKLANELEVTYQTLGNQIFYISLSPVLFPTITRNLKQEGLLSDTGFNRLIIEKPFGNSYETAVTLQYQLTNSFNEDQIYRIDHYLGKEIVHSLRYLRFNNFVLKNLWDNQGIDNIQIILDEEVGVENRGSYYDLSGATRDMIQNHVLQILALAAMNEPDAENSQALRDSKIEVLKNLVFYQNVEELNENVVRGQYGESEDKLFPGYRQETSVNSDSFTETFFAAKVLIDLPKWQGIPFFIRSGKRMKRKVSVINIVFKNEEPNLEPNRLRIEIGPNLSYQLFINSKIPGYDNHCESIAFKYDYSLKEVKNMPVDYERLIFECINGNLDNFNHFYEIANAWKFVDHIHELWKLAPQPSFPNYPANSDGPIEAHKLLEKHQTHWYD